MSADLHAAFARAVAQWPRVELDYPRYEAFVTARLWQQPQALEELALVEACCRGAPRALQVLEAQLRAQVQAVVARQGGAALADELTQRLLTKLLVGAPPRLSTFSGRGALSGWLRAAALRESLNLARGAQSVDDSEAVLERTPAPAQPLELQLLQRRHAEAFQAAFREGLAALEPQERELVRLHCLENVSLLELSRRWAVHRTTLARWLEVARHKIALATRDRLSSTLQLSRPELESLVGFLHQQVDVSLTGLRAG